MPQPSPPDSTLPSMFVLGAMKCGTSSLHYYLDAHPEVAMSNPKETNFFLDREPTVPVGADAVTASLLKEESRSARGIDWYRSRFAEGRIKGESSVAYGFPWYPGVAAAIATLVPTARFVFCVRRPLERMVSHYLQFAARDGRPLERALTAPGNPYLTASRYRTALEPYLARFGEERILVVRHRDLLRDRERELARIFRFLGVDPGFRSPAFAVERNASAGKGRGYRALERLRAGPPGRVVTMLPAGLRVATERVLRRRGTAERPSLDPALARELTDELEPEIVGIEELTGWDLGEWRDPRAP